MAQEQWLVSPGHIKTIDIARVRKMKIGLIGGQVDVIGHDEPGARVEVHSVSGKDLKISIDGDTLEIDHPQLRWDNFLDAFRSFSGRASADVSVLVPRDVAVKLGVVSADALVSGLKTDAKLSTVSGELTVDGLVGDLEVNSVGGEVSVRDHTGSISAHTVSGDVTATGSMHSFNVDSVSANTFLDLTGAPFEIAANAVSGNVTIRLDDMTGARYRVNTISGRIHLDGADFRRTVGKPITHQSESLDGSWVDVTLNSVSGDVSVVRRPSTSSGTAEGSGTTEGSGTAESSGTAEGSGTTEGAGTTEGEATK